MQHACNDGRHIHVHFRQHRGYGNRVYDKGLPGFPFLIFMLFACKRKRFFEHGKIDVRIVRLQQFFQFLKLFRVFHVRSPLDLRPAINSGCAELRFPRLLHDAEILLILSLD